MYVEGLYINQALIERSLNRKSERRWYTVQKIGRGPFDPLRKAYGHYGLEL